MGIGKGKSNYELLGISLAVAFSIAVSCACAVRADQVSGIAYVQDLSVGYMQTAADLVSAGRGDFSLLFGFYGDACERAEDGGILIRFDADMRPTADVGAARHVIRVGAPACDGFLGTASVQLLDMAGDALWSITASWQEGGAGWAD